MNSMQRYTIVLAVAVSVSAATAGREVYFAVTHADGQVRNLPNVPADKKGITSVARVTRIVPRGTTYEVYSTHGRPVRTIDGVRTERLALAWNGKAWVGPGAAARPTGKPADPASPGDVPMTGQRPGEIMKTEALLEALGRLADKYARRLADARKAVAAADEAGKVAALESLARAKFAHDNCTKAIAQCQGRLANLLAGRTVTPTTEPLQSGTVAPAVQTPPGAGVIRPVEDSAILPHRVQVWPLKPGKGMRTCRVSMAHTEAGVYGAFYYVAYSDSTGNGVPDKLIARSALAQADRAGGWTLWTFQTDAPRVFVGNTWPRADTRQYSRKRKPRTREANWSGLGDEIYVSGFFGAMPTKKHKFWPYLHNIRVQLHEHNRRKGGGKAESIIRERP